MLEVLAESGASQAAAFSIASLVAGFLNVIPATASQVLFAEASRTGITMGGQLRKAIRAIYGLLIPALLVMVVAAPLIMRIFGATYAAQGTNCLRILALSALLTGGTYLVDSMLIARDRTGAYLFMNGANAVLVLGCVGVALQHGITGGAVGWALGQGASLLLGLGVVVTGKTGRHRRGEEALPVTGAETASAAEETSGTDESRAWAPGMTAARITMPIMLTTGAGAEESLRALSERLMRRPVAPRPPQRSARPGEVAYCGVWVPAGSDSRGVPPGPDLTAASRAHRGQRLLRLDRRGPDPLPAHSGSARRMLGGPGSAGWSAAPGLGHRPAA